MSANNGDEKPKENPFKIVEAELTTSHSPRNPEQDAQLRELLIALPIDKKKAVMIPATVVAKRAAVQNFLARIVEQIHTRHTHLKEATYTSRQVLDADGKYVGSQVWRIK